MNILIPQGIGDSIWALHKVEDLAAKQGDGHIHIHIACIHPNDLVESRALEFVRRFKFVESAQMYSMPQHPEKLGAVLLIGSPADEHGYYRYIPDGPPDPPLDGIDYVLMPNTPLEHGIRLEDWLPEFRTNWKVMDDFQFTNGEIKMAQAFADAGEYAVLFLGSETSNTISGHNRSGIWKPEQWVELGTKIKELGLRVVVVGAEYDRSYFDNHIKVGDWENLIGACGVGLTLALLKRARFIISYQSGIGIVASNLGVPVGIFWRAKGDSIHPHYYLSFEESMASAWANPDMISTGKHLPLIYGRHDVDYIISQVKERKW